MRVTLRMLYLWPYSYIVLEFQTKLLQIREHAPKYGTLSFLFAKRGCTDYQLIILALAPRAPAPPAAPTATTVLHVLNFRNPRTLDRETALFGNEHWKYLVRWRKHIFFSALSVSSDRSHTVHHYVDYPPIRQQQMFLMSRQERKGLRNVGHGRQPAPAALACPLDALVRRSFHLGLRLRVKEREDTK